MCNYFFSFPAPLVEALAVVAAGGFAPVVGTAGVAACLPACDEPLGTEGGEMRVYDLQQALWWQQALRWG